MERPARGAGAAGAEDEVGAAARDGVRDARQLARVERGVAVHEAHDVALGGLQAGPAGGAEAAPRLVHDLRAELRGERARAVGGAVVDHDRHVAGRHRAEYPGQGLALVEDGEDDGDHVRLSLRRTRCYRMTAP
jgi:hypothetical protein